MTGVWLEELTWPEAKARFDSDAVVVIPIGAASKAHGAHLPLKTDALTARALAQRLVERLPVVAAPVVGFGYYPAFTGFAGSQHLGADTFRALMRELIASFTAHGVRRIALINTGVSTEKPLDEVAAETGALALHMRLTGQAAEPLIEHREGGHADERETSIMLAIAPELVRMELAKRDYGREPALGVFVTPTTMQSTDANAADYSETGAFGDPTLASAEKGRAFLDVMIADLIEGLIAMFPDLQSAR